MSVTRIAPGELLVFCFLALLLFGFVAAEVFLGLGELDVLL